MPSPRCFFRMCPASSISSFLYCYRFVDPDSSKTSRTRQNQSEHRAAHPAFKPRPLQLGMNGDTFFYNQGRPKHNHNHNFPKKFCIWCHTKTAFDDTSDEKSLWFLCVPLCRRGIWCVIRGYPKNEKWGPREMNSKMVVVVVGPALIQRHQRNVLSSLLPLLKGNSLSEETFLEYRSSQNYYRQSCLLFLRIDFPQITVTVTVLKFGWINLITITVTVLASAVTPSFPLVPNYRLESRLFEFIFKKLPLPSWNAFELER